MTERDRFGEGEATEDSETELRKNVRAELVLAALTGALVLATILTHGWVRLVLAITSGLFAAVLAWSLVVLTVTEVTAHALQGLGVLRKRRGRSP